MTENLKIITFNAKGLKGPEKRHKVFDWLNTKKPDVLLIQESHYENVDKKDWEKKWNGTIYASPGLGNSRGVCTLLSADLNYKELGVYKDQEGRWIIVDIDIMNVRVCIANYYGPNIDKTNDLTNLLFKLDSLKCDNIIFGGDLNFVFNIMMDKEGGRPHTNDKCRKKMLDWMEKHSASDIWRRMNPNKRQFTWTSNTTPKIQCRLDHFITSEDITSRSLKCSILPGYSSDHSMVSLSLALKKDNRGKGYWKFNASVLRDKAFNDMIKNCIKRTVEENTPCSRRLLWDTTKCAMRRECIKYCTTKKKKSIELQNQLERCIEAKEEELTRAISSKVNTTDIEEEMEDLKHQLDAIFEGKCRGAAIRSRSLNYEYGEKANKYYLNLEAQKGEKQSIKCLIKEDGTLTTSQEEILQEEYDYYQNLYSNKDTLHDSALDDEWNSLFNAEAPKVDEEYHQKLTTSIQEEEIFKIIRNSSKDKSPGIDGFTNEFYLHFWPEIKTYMLDAYNEGLDNGELCISQRRGAISLLPKEGKDSRHLKNWRPITLLNSDYKYLAKCLADRCKNILPDIISKDQNGFVKGRQIGSNIIRILETIQACEEEEIDGLMVNIDIEKAFDSVSWKFLNKALQFFNFPKKFINWVESLYNNGEVCTTNNGHSSRFIKLGRGMRQGCPLSPILFVICIELLSIYIKNDHTIKGLPIYGEISVISQFADDTSFFVVGERDNLDNLFRALETFGKMSGLKVNIDKTELLPLGRLREEDIPGIYRQLVKPCVKVLGCKITRDLEDTVNRNYSEAYDKMVKALDFWAKKPLSLVGKINMLKCQILSKLLYCMTVLPSPDKSYWDKTNKLIYTFLANNKQEKLKRSTLINEYKQGGLQVTDIQTQNTALKCTWLLRACTDEAPWNKRLRHHLKGISLEDLVYGNVKFEDIQEWIPKKSIWEEIMRTWCKMNYRGKIDTAHDASAQQIWVNSNIKIGGKILHKSKWIEEGITQVWDIIDNEKKDLMSYRDFVNRNAIKTHFLEYGGIKKAIPGEWRKMIRASEEEINIDKATASPITEWSRSKRPSKYLYNKILKTKSTKPLDKMSRWIQDLQIDLEPECLLKNMEKTRKATPYTVLQSFNYNYYSRNITYGARLYNMGIDEDNLCKRCKVKESIIHLYWECPDSEKLWAHSYSLLNVAKTKEICLLDIQDDLTDKNLTNIMRTINLVTRRYIHVTRCNNETRTTSGLMRMIKKVKRVEEMLEVKGEVNRKKWEALKELY
jgi:exonuclease III